MVAHDDVDRLAKFAAGVVERVPERAITGSPRQVENRALRSSQGGGGVARAELLDVLSVEMQVMVGHLTLVVGGVTDALEIASRRDNQVNGPALAYTVRAALELAGQIVWLLSDQIGGEQRARRYIVWRLADLRAQRLLLREFRTSNEWTAAAAKELDETEAELLTRIDAARWTARQSTNNGPHLQAAALLDADQKPVPMPPLGELVRGVSSTPVSYGLLSVTSHSQRFGVLQGLEVVATSPDGEQHTRVSGFPFDTNLLVGLTVLALNISGRMLGGWNGIDTSELHSSSLELIARAGIR